jgi:LAO/AO transport system kinase
VGAGQDEVEVANMAQTTVVVNTPGYGDGVQALKAGILEIADILVVNKADNPGADGLVTELESMLSLGPHTDYVPPILRTVASRDEGIPELVDAMEEHHRMLQASGMLERRREERARGDVLDAVRAALMRRFLTGTADEELAAAVRRVARRDIDPHTAAAELMRRLFPAD